MFKSELKVTFIGGDLAILDRPLIYRWHDEEVVVTAGFITDFASVPGWVLLPGIIPRVGLIRWASVVHDWIYRGHEEERFTREQADQMLYDAAIEQGMSRWRARTAWLGVRAWGWIVWNKYHS